MCSFHPLKKFFFSTKNKTMLQAAFLSGLPVREEFPGLLWQVGHSKVSPCVGTPRREAVWTVPGGSRHCGVRGTDTLGSQLASGRNHWNGLAFNMESGRVEVRWKVSWPPNSAMISLKISMMLEVGGRAFLSKVPRGQVTPKACLSPWLTTWSLDPTRV